VYIGKRVGVNASSRQFTPQSDGVTPRREWRIFVTLGVKWRVGVTLGVK